MVIQKSSLQWIKFCLFIVKLYLLKKTLSEIYSLGLDLHKKLFFTKLTLKLCQLTIINMIAVWDSRKLWADSKKIQLWSLISLQKQITYLTNDIFLPSHALSKCNNWETVRVFRMCRDDDNLFLTGLSHGRLTLCINAFLEIPSCMRWTL